MKKLLIILITLLAISGDCYSMDSITHNPKPNNPGSSSLTPQQMYDRGESAYNKKDYAEAAKWYLEAADQGHVDAQFLLGDLFERAEDYTKAVKWYRKAADQGHADAQFNLGYMYVMGKGVAEDFEEAVKWFGKAAAQGHEDAKEVLILLLEE